MLVGNLITPMNNRSVVDRIITRITNAIINGELLPGHKIPTENELCENLQVSRNSVREAIKALEAMGVVTIRRAEGTFVADGFSDRMLDPMVYGLILEGGNSPAVIELRRLFEVGTLKLAIEKANESDVTEIRKAFDNLCAVARKKHVDKDELLDADINFHRTLEQAVDNPLVDKVSSVIERLSRMSRARAVENFISNNELEEMIHLHQNVLDVVLKKDETAVAEVVDEHFKYWKNQMK